MASRPAAPNGVVQLTFAGGATLAVTVMTCAQPLVVLAVLPLLPLHLCRRRLLRATLSPTWIATLVLLSLAVSGYALYGDGGSPARVGLELSPSDARTTYVLICVSALALALGSTAVAALTPARPGPVSVGVLAVPIAARRWMWRGVLTGWLVAVPSFGPLMERETYFWVARGSFGALVAPICLAAIATLGYLIVTTQGLLKLATVPLVFIYFVPLFASATRQLALAPVLFAVGVLAASRGRRPLALLAVAGLAAVQFIPVATFLRSRPRHGLLPYLHYLPDFATAGTLERTIANISSAFPVTGITATQATQPTWATLTTSLNPLPGSVAGWYEIAPAMRVNAFVPFSAIGEIGNVGWIAVATIWFGFGAGLAYFDRRIRTYLTAHLVAPAMAILGITLLFAVLATQYNLRSASRMLLYALVIDFAVRLWLRRGASPRSGRNISVVAVPLGPPRPVPSLRQR
jgi:hypothetical protein